MLRHGQHKTKPKEGSHCCFFCRKNVMECFTLTWPHIDELYDHCKLPKPSAVTCKTCYEKPPDWLYKQFWGGLIMIELSNFKEGKPSIIRDREMARNFIEALKNSDAIKDAKQFIEEGQ